MKLSRHDVDYDFGDLASIVSTEIMRKTLQQYLAMRKSRISVSIFSKCTVHMGLLLHYFGLVAYATVPRS